MTRRTPYDYCHGGPALSREIEELMSGYFLEAAELEARFSHHPEKDGQAEKFEAIREASYAFSKLLVSITPDSREQALCIGKLEEVVFWAKAAIERRA